MPTNVRMFVWVERHLHEVGLTSLRAEMIERFQRQEDQIFHSEGPLIYADEFDREDIPIQGNAGDLLNVNLCRAYYGVGYERGYFPLFISVAEWLEEKLADCAILYGDDCTDKLSLFDGTGRGKLLKYYDTVGHRPYECQDWDTKRRYWELYDA